MSKLIKKFQSPWMSMPVSSYYDYPAGVKEIPKAVKELDNAARTWAMTTAATINVGENLGKYGDLQDTHLYGKKDREEAVLSSGNYIKGNESDQSISDNLFRRKYPVYRRGPDQVPITGELTYIGRGIGGDPFTYRKMKNGTYREGFYVPKSSNEFTNQALIFPGSYNSFWFHDRQGNVYRYSLDLNDYGGKGGTTASIAGKILDFLGTPAVQVTGMVKQIENGRHINIHDKNFDQTLAGQKIKEIINKRGLDYGAWKENPRSDNQLLQEVVVTPRKFWDMRNYTTPSFKTHKKGGLLKKYQNPDSPLNKKIHKLFNESKESYRKFFSSDDYKERLMRTGVEYDPDVYNTIFDNINLEQIGEARTLDKGRMLGMPGAIYYGPGTTEKDVDENYLNSAVYGTAAASVVKSIPYNEKMKEYNKSVYERAQKIGKQAWMENPNNNGSLPEEPFSWDYYGDDGFPRSAAIEVYGLAAKEGLTPEEWIEKYPDSTQARMLKAFFVTNKGSAHYLKHFVQNDQQPKDYNQSPLETLYARRGARLIPKAQFGTGLFKRGLNWLSNHMAPTREQTMFEVQNNARAEKREKQSNGRQLKDLQKDLIKYGYLPKGADDNKIGPQTRKAIQAAKNDGFKIDGYNLTAPKKLLKKKEESKKENNKEEPSFFDKLVNFFTGEPQSEEQYIKEKQKETREKAALINKSTATPTFPIGNYMVGHDFDYYGNTADGEGSAKNMTEKEVKDLFTKYKKQAETYLKKHKDIPEESKRQIKRAIDYYDKVIKDPKTVAKPGQGIGFGCIFSASHGYKQDGLSSSNQNVFANNIQLANDAMNNPNSSYELLPFKGTKLQIGDIIQIGKSGEGRRGPHHAVMVTGFNIFGTPLVTQTNADTAGMDDRDINSLWSYLGVLGASLGDDEGKPGYQPQGLQIIRFKGSPSDRKKWASEYASSRR